MSPDGKVQVVLESRFYVLARWDGFLQHSDCKGQPVCHSHLNSQALRTHLLYPP